MFRAHMNGPTRRQDFLVPSPHLRDCPSTPQSPASRPTTASQNSDPSSFLTPDEYFLTPNQTPTSAAAHSRVSLLVQSSSSQIPPHSNINLGELNLLLSPASSDSLSSSTRTSSSSSASFLTSSKMSSHEDLARTNDTPIIEPLSLGNLYQSNQVFGLSPPSTHSYSQRISFTTDQDAFSYRKIGPAIVLKSYQPKNPTLDSSSSASTNLEDLAQSEDFDRYTLRAPFTYSADSIYAELNLVDPDRYHSAHDEQMTPLLQFDEDSLETQVEQSYRTAATTASCPDLAQTSDVFRSCEFEATELTNKPKVIDQLDFLSGDVDPLPPISSHSQPQTDLTVSELIPPLLSGNPHENPESLLLDRVIENPAPKEIVGAELEPSHCPSNLCTAPSDQTSAPPPLSDMPNSLLGLDSSEAPADNSLKISVSTLAPMEDKNTTVSSSTDTLNEPVGNLDSDSSHVDEHKQLGTDCNETSQKDSTHLINPQGEIVSKSDDQVTVESTVIQSSRPMSTVNPTISQLAHGNGADKSALQNIDCPSKSTSPVNSLNVGVDNPPVDINSKTPASDPLTTTSADHQPVSVSVKPEVVKQGDPATTVVTDLPSSNLDISAENPVQTMESSEVQAAPAVQCGTIPAVSGVKDNVATSTEKQKVSVNTSPQETDSVAKENIVPESGRDVKLTTDKESSNNVTDKTQAFTPLSSKQANRMRSISGFFKTLNKKQNVKADIPSSPGSASIKSSEEEQGPVAIKALPKRKSLSSLKVKARFSSFYRSPDEPLPTIPKAMEPPRISEEKRDVIVGAEGKTTPLKKCETISPSTPKDKEQPSQPAQATKQIISAAEFKAKKITQPYKISRATRGLRSRSQTIIPPSSSPMDNTDKQFPSVVGELGNASFPRPKTLRKKRTFTPQASTPVLKDITLGGLISKLMRKNTPKTSEA